MPYIIFLTAKSSVAEKVLGLSLGADDYITKTADFLELKARIESKLKKRREQQSQTRKERIGNIEINHDIQTVMHMDGTKQSSVNLTRIEYKILSFLASKKDSIIKRDDILDRVWGNGFHIYPRAIDTHVSNLRRKIQMTAVNIETIHGVGYKLTASPAVTSNQLN